MRKPDQAKQKKDWFRIENAWVDEDNKDDEKTVIYIYDEIGDSWWGESTSANEFVQQLSTIKSKNIELHLNSPGGDIFDGVAIYNALKSHSAEVTVIVDALAASAASFIAQAGDKIIMTRAATMMIHDGAGLVWGTASDMRDTADLLDKLSNTVADIYSARAGESVEFWRNLMIEEVWYNSSEAVEAGLADEVGADTKEDDDDNAKNKWDFSVFNYAGRGAAPNPFQTRQRIANQLKEAQVSGTKQKNQTDPAPESTPGQAPPENPEDPDEAVNPASPDTNPAAPTTEDPAPSSTPSEDPEVSDKGVKVVKNSAGEFVFTVGGRQVTDPQAVQQHITVLEEFQRETNTAGRKAFVKALATDNKLAATQLDATEKFVLNLNDKDYEAWKATWDGAPALPMFQSHASGSDGSNGHAPSSGTEAEIEVKKEVLARLKGSGLKKEQLEKTDAYARLIELQPDFKL